MRRLLSRCGDPPIQVRLWDDEVIAPQKQTTPHEFSIGDRATLWKLACDPVYQFGEAYADGRLKVNGDLTEALTTLFAQFRRKNCRDSLLGMLRDRLRRRWTASIARDRRNIHHHYDIGNEFYSLWLDAQLAYTCAFFAEPEFTLEQAQTAKMELVSRKLDLKPGEKVIEAGCGWGALALHMARHWGVTVRAYNISHEQIVYARRRAAQEGLARRVEFVEDDWRNIEGECDAFVSVGMLEHVAPSNYRRLGEVIDRTLGDHGRGLIHTIGQNRPLPPNIWLERRVFPGGHVPTLREMTRIFEPFDLSVLDVENLRLHYAQTLRHWLRRFEDSADDVRKMFDERFLRMWRLYLASCVAAFEAGSSQLYQVVFARPLNNGIPLTRNHLCGDCRPPLPEGD